MLQYLHILEMEVPIESPALATKAVAVDKNHLGPSHLPQNV